MFLNDKDLRISEQRRKDLRREAQQERLAKEYRRGQQKRSIQKASPLWMRIWFLF